MPGMVRFTEQLQVAVSPEMLSAEGGQLSDTLIPGMPLKVSCHLFATLDFMPGQAACIPPTLCALSAELKLPIDLVIAEQTRPQPAVCG